MMKPILLVLLIGLHDRCSFAQGHTVGDSMKVSFFLPRSKVIDSNDLKLHIVTKNLTSRTIRVYRELEEADKEDRFGNIFIDMQKMKDGQYKRHPMRTYRNAFEYDEAHRHYDIDRKELAAFKSDTLILNVLQVSKGFFKGSYRFKAYLRIQTIPDNKPYDYSKAEEVPPMDTLKYINSSWIYFTIDKDIMGIILGPDGKPRKASGR